MSSHVVAWAAHRNKVVGVMMSAREVAGVTMAAREVAGVTMAAREVAVARADDAKVAASLRALRRDRRGATISNDAATIARRCHQRPGRRAELCG